MRAVMCEEFGPPEKLQLREVDTPAPKPREVLIRVEGCGVNFPETLIIQDKYQFKPPLPFTPGGEVAGVIEAIGDKVQGLAVGDKVLGLGLTGGYAEQMVLDAATVLKRPDGMSGVEAAGFTMTYGTSMHALKQRAELKVGETLLVLGAGGGVGLAAVEIGKAMGATVIAAASSPEKLEAAQKAGADHLINYSQEDLRARLKEITKGQGVDVFYDPVGGDLFEQALRSMAWKGRALVVGFAAGDIPKVPVNLALLKGCQIVGVFWGAFRMREADVDKANFEELFEWFAQGKLRPQVTREYGLDEAPQALSDMMERRVVGKVVIRP